MKKHYSKLFALFFIGFLTLPLTAQVTVTVSGTNCTPSHDGAITEALDQTYTYQGDLNGNSGNPGFGGLSDIWKYWFSASNVTIIASDDQGNFILAHTNNETVYYTATGTPGGDPPCNGWVEASGNYCNQPNIVLSGSCETIIASEPEIDIKYNTNSLPSSSSLPVTAFTGSDPIELVITIENTGTGTLNLTGTPAVTVAGAPNVSIMTQPATTIAPSSSTTFTVLFDPGCTAGPALSTLNILNDDSDEGNYSLSLSGTINASSISYDPPVYCVDGSDPTPSITGATGGTFSAPANLEINPTSGEIDLSSSTPGTYSVDYTSNGCTLNSSVLINAVPVPVVNGSRTYCSADGSTTLEVEGTYDSYLWESGAVTKTFEATGAHSSLNVTVTLDGCSGSLSTPLSIREIASPASSITGATAVCNGDESTIDVTTSQLGVTYSLRDNDDNTTIGELAYGTGSLLTIPTGELSEDITYNVFAQTTTLETTALALDGLDDRVEVNTGGEVITGQYTVEAWVNPSVTTGSMTILSTRRPDEFSFDFKLQNGDLIHGDIGNGSGWINTAADATFNYEAGTWYHIAYVVTETGYTIYANGQAIGSGVFSGQPLLIDATHPILIGGYTSTIESFNGAIDELRIWNVERTAQQIQDNYEISIDPSQVGLVAYYDFNDGTGSSVLSDLTPNNYDGTLSAVDVNTAWVTDAIIDQVTCSAELPNTVSVSITTVDTSMVQVGETLTANATGASFQWLDCSDFIAITGETSEDFTVITDGSYAVEVTQNACVDTSKCVSFVVTGTQTESFGSSFSIYPNPASSMIYTEVGQVQIIDAVGNTVLAQESKGSVDISTLEAGVYLVIFEGKKAKLIIE